MYTARRARGTYTLISAAESASAGSGTGGQPGADSVDVDRSPLVADRLDDVFVEFVGSHNFDFRKARRVKHSARFLAQVGQISRIETHAEHLVAALAQLACADAGIAVFAVGATLAGGALLAPPLVAGPAEVDRALEILTEVLDAQT